MLSMAWEEAKGGWGLGGGCSDEVWVGEIDAKWSGQGFP